MAGQQGPAFSSLVSADTDKRAHAPASIASAVAGRVTVAARTGKGGTGGHSAEPEPLPSVGVPFELEDWQPLTILANIVEAGAKYFTSIHSYFAHQARLDGVPIPAGCRAHPASTGAGGQILIHSVAEQCPAS